MSLNGVMTGMMGYYYDTSPYDNPQGPVSGTFRILRGGCWYDYANFCRVAFRFDGFILSGPDIRNYINGFRIVLDLE